MKEFNKFVIKYADELTFDKYPKWETQLCTRYHNWQRFRNELKGMPVGKKLIELRDYWERYKNESEWVSYRVRVQITNYVNALRRAGQLPPKKYG